MKKKQLENDFKDRKYTRAYELLFYLFSEYDKESVYLRQIKASFA